MSLKFKTYNACFKIATNILHFYLFDTTYAFENVQIVNCLPLKVLHKAKVKQPVSVLHHYLKYSFAAIAFLVPRIVIFSECCIGTRAAMRELYLQRSVEDY